MGYINRTASEERINFLQERRKEIGHLEEAISNLYEEMNSLDSNDETDSVEWLSNSADGLSDVKNYLEQAERAFKTMLVRAVKWAQ